MAESTTQTPQPRGGLDSPGDTRAWLTVGRGGSGESLAPTLGSRARTGFQGHLEGQLGGFGGIGTCGERVGPGSDF